MSKTWDFLLKLFVEMLGKGVNIAKQITNYYLPMILKISISPKVPLNFSLSLNPFSATLCHLYLSITNLPSLFFYKAIFLALGISNAHTHAHPIDYAFQNW